MAKKKTDKAPEKTDAGLPLTPEAKQKAVLAAVAKLQKQFGAGSITKLESDVRLNLEVCPTNLPDLDRALGVGGLPKGRMIEFFGPESSGKTTLCLHCIREVQHAGGTCGYIDIEHAIDKNWAKKIGVDTENLYVMQPDNGEQAMTNLEVLVSSGGFDLIIVDSVAALLAESEQEGDMSSQAPGVQARLMAKAIRKITGIVAKTKTIVIFINQVREKIGVMYGNPETTPGGHALKHAASIRIRVSKGDAIKGSAENDQIGQFAKFNIKKNKVATPYKTAEAPLYFTHGYDKYEDLIRVALDMGILEKKGAWLAFEGQNVGNGVTASIQALKEAQPLYEKILAKYKDKMSSAITVVAEVPKTAEDEEEEKQAVAALDEEAQGEEATPAGATAD